MKWDYTLEDEVLFFDRTKSYELTHYRPIDQENGLDFDITPFIQDAITKDKTGKYCEFSEGSKAYLDFWRERIRRIREGYEVNGYRITGDNYFFINFYRLINPKTLEESFPAFTNVHYEWFHYVEMCELLGYDCVALKSRGCGWSEMAASLCVRPYIAFKNRTMFCTAASETHLAPLLEKCWLLLDWLNLETNGGFKKLRQVKNSIMWKRASMKTADGEEHGSMSLIVGVVADNARKIRGYRSYRLLYEEAGSNPILKTAWVQGEALVTRAGRKTGVRLAWGTGR